MAQGAEDSSQWKHPSNQPGRQNYSVCAACKKKIDIAHCAERGCPWCRACGETVRFVKE